MTREKKLRLNTYVALLYQVITVICGFVLPKIIIPYFGSVTNGLISSITQFLTIITLCECGVGAVVQSALYKPLADKDEKSISEIMVSSNKFFNLIMKALGVYIVLLMIIYPIIINEKYDFGWVYTSSLILILALNYIAQYYLFLTYRLLLNADQASYIQLSVHCIQLILNTIFTAVCVRLGAGVHVVKIVSAIVFLIQPIFLKKYVDSHYNIDWNVELVEEPIKQKWNGMAQHIASVILSSTDTVVLTVFSSLENVSIYGVYYLVVHGVRQIIVSFSTGIQSMFGNMLARNELKILDDSFSRIELIFHFIVSYLFFMTGRMIIPFIKIYTKNFNDTNYVLPFFSILMVFAQASYCIRIPYETMIKAAGHYKETQLSSIIEAILNIVISIVLVVILPMNINLIGVAVGTIIAMTYRTVYLVLYLSENILYRKIGIFIKLLFTDCIAITISFFATIFIPKFYDNYLHWGVSALFNALVSMMIFGLIYYLIYRKKLLKAIKMFIA